MNLRSRFDFWLIVLPLGTRWRAGSNPGRLVSGTNLFRGELAKLPECAALISVAEFGLVSRAASDDDAAIFYFTKHLARAEGTLLAVAVSPYTAVPGLLRSIGRSNWEDWARAVALMRPTDWDPLEFITQDGGATFLFSRFTHAEVEEWSENPLEYDPTKPYLWGWAMNVSFEVTAATEEGVRAVEIWVRNKHKNDHRNGYGFAAKWKFFSRDKQFALLARTLPAMALETERYLRRLFLPEAIVRNTWLHDAPNDHFPGRGLVGVKME